LKEDGHVLTGLQPVVVERSRVEELSMVVAYSVGSTSTRCWLIPVKPQAFPLLLADIPFALAYPLFLALLLHLAIPFELAVLLIGLPPLQVPFPLYDVSVLVGRVHGRA
jgi:hypothetical protein